ncbi:MAG: CDP-diacylglycerol--glycerol-3-phosphate 3-phosphatidyltransferase [Erysipelotrichaceae bacterium]|jgi:CDP-diacylglycerol--glycerol-3-phosphate 3-phosphatidyltransferase|nr:CDP-diacylglycerol--glycerol-3-phosphate 3-phosphatidyltransferase [Erysipelotrichaceae bacterium]
MNLPNKLTMFRICLIPLIVLVYIFPYASFSLTLPQLRISFVLIPGKNLIILVLFLIGCITDFLDGYLARSREMVTSFGKFLDPIADKLLINTMFILFCVDSVIPVVPVLIMVWRDSVVDGIRMMAGSKGVVLPAGFLGKLKTILQMITVVLILLANLPFELIALPATDFFLWFSTFISLFSGFSYFMANREIIMESV